MAKKKIKEELTEDLVDSGSPEQIIADCRNIINNGGWKRIIEVLDIKIKSYSEEILDTDVQGEELSRLRDRRDLCLYFRNLPQILIANFEATPDVIDTQDLDPYERIDIPKNTT